MLSNGSWFFKFYLNFLSLLTFEITLWESPYNKVTPAAGIIEVNQIVEVSVRHEEFQILEEFVDGSPQNCWCEETKDKEVILVVDVSGSFTTNKRSHRIRVRCCFPLTTTQIDSKSNNSRQPQGNLLHRSDMQHLGSSSDVVSHIRDLHGP